MNASKIAEIVVGIVFMILMIFFGVLFYKIVYVINFVSLKKGSDVFSLIFFAYLLVCCKYK